MTQDSEGTAALEAAVNACWTDHRESITLHARMQDAIRAYLRALPGWRLVPLNEPPQNLLTLTVPPPPGLEPDSHFSAESTS